MKQSGGDEVIYLITRLQVFDLTSSNDPTSLEVFVSNLHFSLRQLYGLKAMRAKPLREKNLRSLSYMRSMFV
jgi:hypothetical protein